MLLLECSNMSAEAKQTSQSITPSTGVVLLAFGKIQYYWAAYNLAFSIKKFNPSIRIALITDDKGKALSQCPELGVLTELINDIAQDDIYTNKKLDPAKLKVKLYDYLPYERNLYLDVDAIALKDIQPMIDELSQSGKDYISHTVGYHTIDKGRDFKEMQWAWADKIWAHFELPADAVMPAINSSMQWIVKGEQAAAIYRTAQDLYLNNPIPLKDLRMKWGGSQPDELYMNISMAIHKVDPALKAYDKIKTSEGGMIHFAMTRGLTFQEITEKFYLQSYYGGNGFTPNFYIDWLDRMLKADHQAIGKRHIYYINRIVQNKFADAKR
jgi:hypothetical protein